MLAALTTLDFAVAGFLLAGLVVLGIYWSGRQRTAPEFLLAGRSLGWRQLGASLVAALIPGQLWLALPAAGYEQGLRTWVVPAALWIALPLVLWVLVPLYRGLGLDSLYEYLELRFDSRVRFAGGMVFFVWRLILIAALATWPCRAALVAAGWTIIPTWWVIVLIGLLATLIAFLGGLRTVVGTGVAAAVAIAVAAIVVIAAVWLSLDGGPVRVAQIASGLRRTESTAAAFAWTDAWSLAAALPFWCLTTLLLVVGDHATTGRLLGAKDVNVARTACLTGTLGLTLLVPALLYAGVCLLAFYYDRPGEMRPEWVTNIDGATREPLRGPDGGLLLDETNPGHEISAVTIDQLIAQRRILQPKNKEPLESSASLIDAETNRVLVEKLAMRRPPSGKFNGEFIVSRAAPGQMLPALAARHLPLGAAGLVVAAILASLISIWVSGIHGLVTWLVVDLHRRFGWLRSTSDELRLARPLTLVVGLGVTILAAGLDQFATTVPPILLASGALGGPLLAVFLLGILTRRATAAAVLVALVLGFALVVVLAIIRPPNLAEPWLLVFSFAATLLIGYLLSFVVGRRRPNADLRGLVAGCGTLGVRATNEPSPRLSRR
jgi:Na+/proline symporter